MKTQNEDPKMGILLVVMAPIITTNKLLNKSKRIEALMEGAAVLAAGTLILANVPVAKIINTIKRIFHE